MRLLVQRVSDASVAISGRTTARIGRGLLALVGIGWDDRPEDAAFLAAKLTALRIFDDERGVMNLDVRQIQGEVLIVSQFTLMASTRRGNRPSWAGAADEAFARPLYGQFVEAVARQLGREPATGCFGADMRVSLVNEGPVTIWMDSKRKE